MPTVLRLLWSQKRSLAETKDIFQVEAIGPLLILYNWGYLLAGHLWIHFIDNEGSLAALAKGSSSVMSGEVIVGATHEIAAKYGITSWFDRVDTKSNPVDQLSRGVMKGPWRLLRIRFPHYLLERIREVTHSP